MTVLIWLILKEGSLIWLILKEGALIWLILKEGALIWLTLKEGAGFLLLTHLAVLMLKQRVPAAGALTRAPRRWPACRQREMA